MQTFLNRIGGHESAGLGVVTNEEIGAPHAISSGLMREFFSRTRVILCHRRYGSNSTCNFQRAPLTPKGGSK